MAEKIFTCKICGKEVTLKDKNCSFMQIQYRTITPNYAWESQWKTLCPDCFDYFLKWLNQKKENDVNG